MISLSSKAHFRQRVIKNQDKYEALTIDDSTNGKENIFEIRFTFSKNMIYCKSTIKRKHHMGH